MIRNYLGFPRGISGMRLAQRARNQAIRFGTQFFTGWPATGLELGARRGAPRRAHRGRRRPRAGGRHRLRRHLPQARGRGDRRAGRQRRQLRRRDDGRPGDGGADVFVVGGGNSAGQAAIHLSRFARSVTILVRRPDLERDHVVVPDRRDRVQPADHHRGLPRGGRRWRRGPARVDRGRGHDVRPAHPPRGRRAVPPPRRRRPLRLAAARGRARPDGFVLTGRDVPWTPGATASRRRTSRPRCPGSSPSATSAPAR